jgi:hypothetical protein
VKIEDVRIVREPLVLATPADVAGLESRLWITFPEGYRDYVTRLGEGILGGSFVRIYPPWRVANELAEWRRRIDKYWFWDESHDVLPKERALECVIVGDTINGDELVFHPTRRDHLFVLPADGERVFDAGPDVLAAVEWMCNSGELTEPFAERDFEPFDSRLEAEEAKPKPGQVDDPEGESLDDLVGQGRRWAERHAIRKSVEQDVKKQVGDLARQFGQERTSTRLYEAIVLDGEFPHEPGYIAVFRVNDRASGLEVGTLTWHKGEHASGAGYVPNQANVAKLSRPQSPPG